MIECRECIYAKYLLKGLRPNYAACDRYEISVLNGGLVCKNLKKPNLFQRIAWRIRRFIWMHKYNIKLD
jgi:hypothetical protein